MASKNDNHDNQGRRPDLSALYALVGVADYAVSQARDAVDNATERVAEFGGELRPSAVQARVSKAAGDVREQILDVLVQLEQLPADVQERVGNVSADLEDSYHDFADRGERVVEDLRNQPAAKRLSSAADEVAEETRSAVSRARRTAEEVSADVQNRAVGTAQAGRKQAAKGVAALAGQVEDAADAISDTAAEVQDDADTVKRSAAAKEGAAGRTARPNRSSVTKKAAAKLAKKVAQGRELRLSSGNSDGDEGTDGGRSGKSKSAQSKSTQSKPAQSKAKPAKAKPAKKKSDDDGDKAPVGPPLSQRPATPQEQPVTKLGFLGMIGLVITNVLARRKRQHG